MIKNDKNKIKRIPGLAVLAIAAVLIVTQSGSEEVIKIGWIGPQTGQSAVLGMDSFVAAQIAVDEINAKGGIDGKQVELIIEDDQYNIKKALDSYHKLVDVDGVKIIMANTYGSVFALANQVEKDGVLIMDPLDCNSELAGLSDNIFCLATDSESIAEVLAETSYERGARKAGIVYFNSDTFMPLIKDVFVQEFKGDVVLAEGVTAGTKDFKTIVIKMFDSGIDSLVLLGYDEMGIAMKQARELGYEGEFYMPGTVTSPSLQEAAQGYAEGTILAFWDAPKSTEPAKSFTEEFVKRQGREPILDLATYPSYDSVKAIATAIDDADSLEIAKLKQSLLKMQGFTGVTGYVTFAADGSMRIPETAHILEDGLHVLE